MKLDDIMDRIIAAVDTLSRLPPAFLKARSGFWPDVIHRYEEAYAYTQATYRREPPDAHEITQMDEALKWLGHLNHGRENLIRKKIIWYRAEQLAHPFSRPTWRGVALRVGLRKDKCREEFRIGLVIIQTRIKDQSEKHQSHKYS